MSDHPVTNPTHPITGLPGLLEAVTAAIRAPTEVRGGSPVVYVFTPDLTAAQTTTFANTVAAVRAAVVLPATDYAAISPQLVTGRAFLALSQSQFIALTQNERDRMLFDNVSAQWRVIFRLLRE